MNCYINKIKNKCIAFYSECKNNFMKYFLKFLKIVPGLLLSLIFLLLLPYILVQFKNLL